MATNAATTITTYLESLGTKVKPQVDREAIKALKAQIKAETNVVAKAKLLTALEDASTPKEPDFSGEEAVFIAEGKAWAEKEGISGSALAALGVPLDVLRQAGFSVSTKTTERTRAKALDLEALQAAVASFGGEAFTLKELAEKVDSSPATIRNWLDKLKLKEAGKRPAERGSPAKLYKA